MSDDRTDDRTDDPSTRDGVRFERRELLRAVVPVTVLGMIAAACSRSDRVTSATTPPTTTTTTTTATTTTTTTTTTATTPSTAPTTAPTVTSAATSTTSAPATTSTSTTTTPSTATSGPASGDPSLQTGAYDPEALYVALYGHPGSTILGVLGEQDAEAGARRAIEVAAAYEAFGRRVVPTFEIIASVAAAQAGSDGDYSNEFSFDRFEPHLRAAAANGMHVVFDLQTGRSRFPDQAREYEALWLQPHASLALDPVGGVGPHQRPGGGRIGTVDAAEVNETIDYIDALIAANGLPRKMCIVHQFAESMITNKQQIRGTDNVQVLIQMDGFGTLDLKRGTWARVVSTLPQGAFTGWKNFYDEDRPTPTPAETMANDPQPRYVSYQ
jgi:hypothetical protein